MSGFKVYHDGKEVTALQTAKKLDCACPDIKEAIFLINEEGTLIVEWLSFGVESNCDSLDETYKVVME